MDMDMKAAMLKEIFGPSTDAGVNVTFHWGDVEELAPSAMRGFTIRIPFIPRKDEEIHLRPGSIVGIEHGATFFVTSVAYSVSIEQEDERVGIEVRVRLGFLGLVNPENVPDGMHDDAASLPENRED